MTKKDLTYFDKRKEKANLQKMMAESVTKHRKELYDSTEEFSLEFLKSRDAENQREKE